MMINFKSVRVVDTKVEGSFKFTRVDLNDVRDHQVDISWARLALSPLTLLGSLFSGVLWFLLAFGIAYIVLTVMYHIWDKDLWGALWPPWVRVAAFVIPTVVTDYLLVNERRDRQVNTIMERMARKDRGGGTKCPDILCVRAQEWNSFVRSLRPDVSFPQPLRPFRAKRRWERFPKA